MKAQLEQIPSPLQSVLRVFKYESQEFEAPWHFHPEYELTYIQESGGVRYVGDSVMDFEKGDLVLLGPNLPHCWKNVGTDHKAARSIVVQWQDDNLGQKWMETNEFMGIQKLITHSSRGIKFNRKIVEEVEPMLNNMMFQTSFEKLISLLQILNLLANAKDFLLLSGDNFTAKLNNKSNARISAIHTFVQENYHRKIRLKEVSSLVSMSEEPFCRFFKKTFNKSFFTFLNEYKIKLACKLLIESDQHVTEIAFRSGYESLPFFYRQFNKFIGCSPLAYQQKYTAAFA